MIKQERNNKGQFIKGCPSWNKGLHVRTGGGHQKGTPSWSKGLKLSEEHKKKLREAHLGQRSSISTEFKKGMVPWNKGKKCPQFSGEKHWNWKNGATPINYVVRHSLEYKLWRNQVFERDNYTCQLCKRVGGNMEADHIKPFAYYIELRFNVDNGRTLCIPCHKTTDTYGGKVKNYGNV